MTSEKRPKSKTLAETIKAYCHCCVGSRFDSVIEGCTGHLVFATGGPCPFYKYRLGQKRPTAKIMRQFCLECMGGSKEAVKDCSTADCLIHPFRFGKNPALARKGKCPEEMVHISALRRPLVKENLGYFERSAH
jgi:hypothetical protein